LDRKDEQHEHGHAVFGIFWIHQMLACWHTGLHLKLWIVCIRVSDGALSDEPWYKLSAMATAYLCVGCVESFGKCVDIFDCLPCPCWSGIMDAELESQISETQYWLFKFQIPI